MLLKIFPENPNDKAIQKVVGILSQGGVVIYPTDTVYAMGCALMQHRAVERMALMKGQKPDKVQFALLCDSLSRMADFARPVPNPVFKLMKRNLPGPFAFVLEANNKVPKIFLSKKKTIAVRVPDNPIVRDIVSALGMPLVTTSLWDQEDGAKEYFTDPELIHERFGDRVDLVIDGGYGQTEPSTVVDCTGESPIILRQGLGVLE
jgi:tRNA threonylcarbamoyl adenosine modification protein (Sua5/YciO/YrdC/YwlC family)